jgi:hypothetical protein
MCAAAGYEQSSFVPSAKPAAPKEDYTCKQVQDHLEAERNCGPTTAMHFAGRGCCYTAVERSETPICTLLKAPTTRAVGCKQMYEETENGKACASDWSAGCGVIAPPDEATAATKISELCPTECASGYSAPTRAPTTPPTPVPACDMCAKGGFPAASLVSDRVLRYECQGEGVPKYVNHESIDADQCSAGGATWPAGGKNLLPPHYALSFPSLALSSRCPLSSIIYLASPLLSSRQAHGSPSPVHFSKNMPKTQAHAQATLK